MTKQSNTGSKLEPPKLRQHRETIDGQALLFTELTGKQAVICDVESGLTNDETKDSPLTWFEFRCYFIAMSLEAGTGQSYKELLDVVRQHKAETIGQMYRAARSANGEADEEDEDAPKGDSA